MGTTAGGGDGAAAASAAVDAPAAKEAVGWDFVTTGLGMNAGTEGAVAVVEVKRAPLAFTLE